MQLGVEIVGWGAMETAESRRVKGALSWVKLNTKQGRGYCRLARRHGAAGLGVWTALLEQSARQSKEHRGMLRGSSDDLADVLRLPERELVTVAATLKGLGWIKVHGWPEIPVISAPHGDLRDSSEDPHRRLDKTTPENTTEESEPPAQTRSSKVSRDPPRAAYRVADYLRLAIRSHSPNAKIPASLSGWAGHIDRAMRLDNRSEKDLRRVIEFAHRDEIRGFWRGNLLSAVKLRKHFDTIWAQVQRAGSASSGRGMSVADLLDDEELAGAFSDA